MPSQLNGGEISVNINRAKYEANELIVKPGPACGATDVPHI